MNRLSLTKRTAILHMLVEGASLRSIARATDTSINTVTRLMVDAGRACAEFHDATVRRVRARRLAVGEAWSFARAKAPPGGGDVWTWVALDPDTKLLISCLIGRRDNGSARAFAADVRSRVRNRPQIASDGPDLCVDAIEEAFGADVDSGQVRKPDLNPRMGLKCCTRLADSFAKGLENHVHHTALFTVHHNWCRIDATTERTPAMAAGLTRELCDVDWLAEMVEARRPKPKKPGPAKGTKYKPRRQVWSRSGRQGLQ